MNKNTKNNAIHLIQEKGDVFYYNNFLLKKEAEDLFSLLHKKIAWKQYPITIFGKTMMQPRLVAWYGEAGVRYKYSQTVLVAEGWTKELLFIKNRLQKKLNLSFNSVLLNLYRDGQDSMGWHSDNEKELGDHPIIASISLGNSRKMNFKTKVLTPNIHVQKTNLVLESGSLLLMKGTTQENWQHQIPKTKKVNSPRINLTFRTIV